MKEKFSYQKIFNIDEKKIEYEKVFPFEGKSIDIQNKKFLLVKESSLQKLSYLAFYNISHYLRSSHLSKLKKIILDKEASNNDKYVAFSLLKNANTSSGGILPMCQDTGTALIIAKKGVNVVTSGKDSFFLSKGVYNCFLKNNLRYSQVAAKSMYDERNTKNNLPAQIDIYSEGQHEYKFLFIAKGGGSANKTLLFQATPSVLKTKSIIDYLKPKIASLGTSACPPYHLAIVIGGLSSEMNLKTLKLATCHYLDSIPKKGNYKGLAFRDIKMERNILKMTQDLKIGAQFGGKYFCHDVRVIRLPRHGASLPISIGVSCGGDRKIVGKINENGIFIEK